MTRPLEQALDRFIQRFLDQQRSLGGSLPQVEFDALWPSPCYQLSARERADADEGQPVPWQPVRQAVRNPLFDGLAQALETPIHPDIETFYGRYWSEHLPASSQEGGLSLLQLWNDEDYERLRGNLVGHALAKRKQRQPLTLFFGCTEPDEYVLSIDNESGRVLLEQPGRKPLRELAPSLADFIDRLTPRLPAP